MNSSRFQRDVEWAHAIAPGANIALVIGSNDAKTDEQEDNCAFAGILSTLRYALLNELGQVITISYGGSELGYVSETPDERAQDAEGYRQADMLFQQAAEQQVTVLASSGDEGATSTNDLTKEDSYWDSPNVGWPASSPYVLAVGGTALKVSDANGTYKSESVWNDGTRGGAAGGGLSSVFPEPDYQKGLPNQDMFQGKRGLPDISFPGQPSFALYTSFETGIMGKVNSKWNHWDIIGGTSLSSPCWAGLIAIGNQMRGKPLGFIHSALYSLNGKGFHDITVGNNNFGGVVGFSAQAGYDLATGWGTPIADQFLDALIAALDHPSTQQNQHNLSP